jgi:hypothetical protein
MTGKHDWCEGLEAIRKEVREMQASLRSHQYVIGAIVAIGTCMIGAVTQIQIARMQAANTHVISVR